MIKKSHQYYYSTNAYLAFQIAENFFDGRHFVWCSPVFNPKDCDEFDIHKKIPYSSSPHGIYSLLQEHISTNDNHCDKIDGIKTGLNKAAVIKLTNDVIDESQYRRIIEMVDNASLVDFKPLIYIINKAKISDSRLIKVSVKDAANALSTEYQIHDLVYDEFEIIKF